MRVEILKSHLLPFSVVGTSAMMMLLIPSPLTKVRFIPVTPPPSQIPSTDLRVVLFSTSQYPRRRDQTAKDSRHFDK